MAIKMVGYPTNLGLPVPQQRRAPAAFRSLQAAARLAALAPFQDLGDLPLPAGETIPFGPDLLREVLVQAQRQADWLRQHYHPSDLWVTLGGDHSTSLGTALGLHLTGQDFDIVWIDAHADFNTPDTSPTGNPHGMVLALLCGLAAQQPPTVNPRHIHILGARDVDPGERELLDRHGVHVYTVAESLANIDAITARLRPNVFLSFDTDSMDPAEAPAVQTPVPGGFTREQARSLAALVGARRTLLAVDVVEYYPDLDTDGQTGRAVTDVLATAAGTQIGRLHSLALARSVAGSVAGPAPESQ